MPTSPRRRHIIVSAIEHKSVLEPAQHLTAGGWRVTVAPVHHDGRIDLDALAGTIGDDTALVSVMAANNEIGVLQPLAEIAALAHARGSLLHVDAAQAAGKVPIDVHKDGVDLLSLTAHKMYGPKGAGALFVRKRLEIGALVTGGGHEHGLRAGHRGHGRRIGRARQPQRISPAKPGRCGRTRARPRADADHRLDDRAFRLR